MESNELRTVEQRVNQLHVEKQNIRKRKDSLTQDYMRPPTVNIKTAWERASEGDESFTFETDVKASIREELEILEGRENFIDQAIQGGTIELNRLRGQESLKDCADQRPALVAAVEDLLLHQGSRES